MSALYEEIGFVSTALVILPFLGISLYVSLKENMSIPIIILTACVGVALLLMLAAKRKDEVEKSDEAGEIKKGMAVGGKLKKKTHIYT